MPRDNRFDPIMGQPGVAHALCVEHIPYPGLEFPVCVQKGQDREAILADVDYVMGNAMAPEPVAEEQSHPTHPVHRRRGGTVPQPIHGSTRRYRERRAKHARD